MDHEYINELDLVERYLMGRLAAEETAEFEAHFVDCLECVGQLKTTKALMDGLRIVASEQAPEPLGYEPRGLSWSLRHSGSRKSLALAAGVLLLVALVGAVVVSDQIRRSRVEADQAKSASAEWARRYEEERQSSSLAEMRHQDSERDLKTQLAQLRAEIEIERKQNTGEMADDHGGLKKPQTKLAIFELKSTRGSEPVTGSPNEIIVPRSPANFVISVALEGEGGQHAYRWTIRDGRKRLIWKRSGLKPNRYDLLSVEFNSTFFRDGDYLLTVEEVAGDGSTSVVGKYPFRVLKTQ
ncbi:MAG: hypothetical protein AABN34_07565 [Acidobacteriota bacterium]